MPAGRPSPYGDEMLAKASDYIEDCPDVVPSAAGLAIFLGISRQTVYQWRDDHPEFSDTLATLLAEQERRLINGGLNGEYNSNIAKLMMANHDYVERSERAHTGPDGGPVEWLIDASDKVIDST